MKNTDKINMLSIAKLVEGKLNQQEQIQLRDIVREVIHYSEQNQKDKIIEIIDTLEKSNQACSNVAGKQFVHGMSTAFDLIKHSVKQI